MDQESSIPPRIATERFKELEGQLHIPDPSPISAGFSNVHHGIWTCPTGREVEVAVKEIRLPIPNTRVVDEEQLKKTMDIVGVCK